MPSRSRGTLDSRAASNLPTLTTTSSRSSASTTRTTDANIEPISHLEDNGDGVIPDRELHPHCIFGCPFGFMDCFLAFSSFNDWVSHSLSHFQEFKPPKQNLCAFCDDTFQDADGTRCWEARMRHVADHHIAGLTIWMARPDYNLFQHLRRRGLISEEDFDHLCAHSEQRENMRPRNRSRQTSAVTGPPDAYIIRNSPGRERRQRG